MPVQKFLELMLSTSCRLVGSQIQYIKLVLQKGTGASWALFAQLHRSIWKY